MNKATIVKAFNATVRGLGKNAPGILTGLGVAGGVATVVLAVKATPKAMKLIEEAQQSKKSNEDQPVELTPLEIVKTAWKPYVPVVLTGAVSIACIIGSNSVNARRNAALAAAYKLSETALTEFKEKTIETIGEKKVEKIKESIGRDKIEKNPISKTEVIITEKGNTLCFDGISGRYFKSDIETIRRAENRLNKKMMSDMYISLNEFYYEIGLSGTKVGDDLGWNIDSGLIDLDFSSHLAEDGTPCLLVDYVVAPRYEYHKLM